MAKRKKTSPAEMRKFIHMLRGSLKRKSGDKSFAEWMAEMNREEKALEEAKYARWANMKS